MHISLFLPPLLTAAAIYDLKTKKIPNMLNFSVMGFGIISHSFFSGTEGFIFSLTGLLIGTAIFLPLYIIGGMGAGDVKLMGAVGAVVGVKGVILSAIFTTIYGGIYALLMLIVHHQYGRIFFTRTWAVLKTFFLTRQYVPENIPYSKENIPKLCYGVAIALGTITYQILNYYEYIILY